MTTATALREPVRWSDWVDDPYPLYRLLRDEHPVFHDEPNDMVVLTRYDDVFAVLTSPGRFSNVVEYTAATEGRMSPLREEDPPRHTFLRGIVMPLFTPREMRRLGPYFREVARELLDAAEQGDVVDATAQLGIPLPGRVTCDLLGVPVDQHELFLTLTAERLHVLRTTSGRAVPTGAERPVAEIRADLWSVVGPIAEARRLRPEHDAITLLVQAQDRHGRDELPDGLVVDLLLHLLTGGFHTTMQLVGMLVDLFADRDDLWQRLRADRTLVPAAIEEMLRYEAPSQALRRRALEPTVLHGVEIPRDATIAIVYGSANRDERAFDDPDTYSLDRGPTRHMAFSAGIHYCPGAPVARFEVQALLDEMLDRYERIDRAGPSVRAVDAQTTVETLRGLSSVPVRLARV